MGILATCAISACLGNRRYVDFGIIKIMKKHWGEIPELERKRISEEVQEAIAKNKKMGTAYDLDAERWSDFINWINEQSS